MQLENTPISTTSLDHLLEPESGAGIGLRIGLMAAVAIHLVIFAITWPKVFASEAPPADRIIVHRFPIVNFQPPPPPEQQYTLPPRRIPVPDPDPLGPEPITTCQGMISQELVPEDLVPVIPEPPPLPEERPVPSVAVAGVDVAPPMVLHRVQPEYTETAKTVRIQGPVILSLLIDREGRVAEVDVLRGLPFGLTENAVAAARQWRFQPSTIDGRPVNVRFTLTVRFRLASGPR